MSNASRLEIVAWIICIHVEERFRRPSPTLPDSRAWVPNYIQRLQMLLLDKAGPAEINSIQKLKQSRVHRV